MADRREVRRQADYRAEKPCQPPTTGPDELRRRACLGRGADVAIRARPFQPSSRYSDRATVSTVKHSMVSPGLMSWLA